jgi:hypothetical protein
VQLLLLQTLTARGHRVLSAELREEDDTVACDSNFWLLRWVLLTACVFAFAALVDLSLAILGCRGAPFEPSKRKAVAPLLLVQVTHHRACSLSA